FYKGMRDLTEQTAQAMSQGFSDFFFDIFTNQLKTLGDYLEAFLNSILRATADVLAYMIKAITFGTVQSSGALGGGWLSSAINSLTGAGKTTPAITPGAAVPPGGNYQHGGWIPEPVLGVGKSGKMYSFAELGPEYVNPAGSGGGGDGIDRVIVNNYGPIPAKTSEKKNMMGGRDIIVQISEAMAADVKNEGPLHYQMRRTFGVKPVLGGR
ncbi:MAG: hypothetical protein KJ556_20495, partial [Gammaproteobacteria bacterium]|nr:hypothetical protein [Gammaproteobacteria bacterium]